MRSDNERSLCWKYGVWMVSKVATGHRAPLLFACIGVSCRCPSKHIAQEPSQCMRAERSILHIPAMCTAKHRATEFGPSAGVAFVCLAYQSCENNRVCVASPLSRWPVVSGPSDRMARPVCADHWLLGKREHPWLALLAL